MAGGRSRKVPFNCYLSVEQLDALDVASEREGRPRAELVREAVTQYLTGRNEPDADAETEAMDEAVPQSANDDDKGATETGRQAR